MIKIVFPEYKNETIAAAIELAKEKYADFEPVFADSLEEACGKVRDKEADAMVAGIDYTSRDVILSCRDIIGVRDTGRTEYSETTGRPLKKTFSASFVLTRDDEVYVLGDAAACKNPDEHMLYDIVLQTHETAEAILNEEPRVAMLSFSTLGSGGNDESIERIKAVINRIKEDEPEILIDGELQLDAAINERIGNKKAPGSTVAGRANVLIVPDLNSGNILYKAMEQFGGFTAAGPILQGFNAPVSDLSRGSTKEDVLSVIDVEMKLIKSKND
jgi:phosphate acetyltransferase